MYLPPIVCKSLENDLLIKNGSEYYTGGNQSWFFCLGYKDIAEYGCGIIAICNFLLCFWRAEYKSKNIISKETFTVFVMYIYKKYLYILNNPFIKGLTGFKLSKGINKYFRDNNISMKALWGKRYNILSKVQKSLKDGLPVILGVGPDAFAFLKKKRGIQALDIDNGSIADIYAHYVLIYDCKEENKEIFFYISSWGRRYKLSYNDFNNYQKNTLFGFILSNILEIQKV